MIQEGQLAKQTVVATVMSNMGLEIALGRHGGKVVRTKVGDRYVVRRCARATTTLAVNKAVI